MLVFTFKSGPFLNDSGSIQQNGLDFLVQTRWLIAKMTLPGFFFVCKKYPELTDYFERGMQLAFNIKNGPLFRKIHHPWMGLWHS